jgi:hypothetical protein
MVHGAVVHAPSQLPEEQLHVPAGHETLWRGAPVPGSVTGGPPFGDPPGSVPPEPPQAKTTRPRKPRLASRLRKRALRVASGL